jgi:hypothetical protein
MYKQQAHALLLLVKKGKKKKYTSVYTPSCGISLTSQHVKTIGCIV